LLGGDFQAKSAVWKKKKYFTGQYRGLGRDGRVWMSFARGKRKKLARILWEEKEMGVQKREPQDHSNAVKKKGGGGGAFLDW